MADDDEDYDEVAAAAAGEEEEEEEEDELEDLEKLSAEIARMEKEAARIAAETDELEKNMKAATRTRAKSGRGSGGDATLEEKTKKDGCVLRKIMCLQPALPVFHGLTPEFHSLSLPPSRFPLSFPA